MKNSQWMLTQTEAFALVTRVYAVGPIRLRKGHRIFRDLAGAHAALAAWQEELWSHKMLPYLPPRYEVARFELPHSWLYDTEPATADYFTAKIVLEDGVLCEEQA
jgi:hypothetical protein